MVTPTTIDLHHDLGRAEAKRRLQSRIGDIPKYVPGGIADVQSTWSAEDRLELGIRALGQHIEITLDVDDRLVRVKLVLPGAISFMSGMIAGAIREKGEKLLLNDSASERRTG